MRITIKNDLFDIEKRLKEISPDYGVVFNTDNQKFEITVKGVSKTVLPFDNLDERALRYAYYTRSENVFNVVRDLEKENEENQKNKLKAARDKFENEFSRATRLLGI